MSVHLKSNWDLGQSFCLKKFNLNIGNSPGIKDLMHVLNIDVEYI
jgi:hypothetical protein